MEATRPPFHRRAVLLRVDPGVRANDHHYNYNGYSGVQTSPFFKTPTSVNNPRRWEGGVTMTF